MATGNMTLRPFSIVTEILYDKDKKKATGVRIIDTETKKTTEFFARIIFLNASTIATASILLNSKSSAFPEGLGNSSGHLGHHLMDHHFRVGAEADYDGFQEEYYSGRRPNGIYIPRFRNISPETARKDYLRGFAYQGGAIRATWMDTGMKTQGFGEDYKNAIAKPGKWSMWISAWGETLPYFDNYVALSDKKDQWGLPLPEIHFEFRDNEYAMRKDMQESAKEMLTVAGYQNVKGFDYDVVGGDCIHEMGTARMGLDPKTSVLNKWNQLHDAKNVFVTDGSCMTSSACQSPSITYMALTARACDHAVNEMRTGNL
jgi:choline dehydrogenase-like flavoprotein